MDVSIDSKYVVTGGYLGWMANDSEKEEEWMGAKSDWLLDSCDETDCSEEKNACERQALWRKGFINLYRDQKYEMRKYYMFAKKCKNFEVRDIKLLQVYQNDSVVTSTAELWNLKLLSS